MTPTKTPILKQLMGALVGGTLAVGLYYAYDYGAPVVTGYLITPERFPQFFTDGETTISQKDLSDEKQARITARVRRAINFEPTTSEPVADTTLYGGAPTAAVYAPTYAQTLPAEPAVTTTRITTGPERIIAEERTTTTTETITETRTQAPGLPDSGLPIALFATGLAGSMFGIQRLKK